MSENQHQQLANTLWNIAHDLRGAMHADDFRDYMLSLLFFRHLSGNYQEAVKKELGSDYPLLKKEDTRTPLSVWYAVNEAEVPEFEEQMRRKVHYVIKPEHLWSHITELARTHSDQTLPSLEAAFRHIETESFENSFQGLFSEINLNSEKLGKLPSDRNRMMCTVIQRVSEGIADFDSASDSLGDAYEFLIGKFAAGSGQKAGEFYTPKEVSTILSEIVLLDPQDPTTGVRRRFNAIFDFACGSGSLLLNLRRHIIKSGGSISKLYGQEKNITTFNLARMNMLLHGMKDTEFEIYHGDTLENNWPMLSERNPAKTVRFDAIVANPPFSLRWDPNEVMGEDFRFKGYGLAPKSAADFAFLLHGFHYLAEEGTMAIILPHGVLFRGGNEEKIRKKLLTDNNIDTVIGLPPNLFYSTGIPVCILVLKKCKKYEDVLFINAADRYKPGKRQNTLEEKHIDDIVRVYRERPDHEERFARRVSLAEIERNNWNLNITRYVNISEDEKRINLNEVHQRLNDANKAIRKYTEEHNAFLRELGLPPIE